MNRQRRERIKRLRAIKEGMSWGTREEGMAQLTDNELFLLNEIDRMDQDNISKSKLLEWVVTNYHFFFTKAHLEELIYEIQSGTFDQD